MTGMRELITAPIEERDTRIPAPEVREAQPRPLRRFTARYKADALRQAESCSTLGALAALLRRRREGLYSSHLHRRRLQEQQALEEEPRSRSNPKPPPTHPSSATFPLTTRRSCPQHRHYPLLRTQAPPSPIATPAPTVTPSPRRRGSRRWRCCTSPASPTVLPRRSSSPC